MQSTLYNNTIQNEWKQYYRQVYNYKIADWTHPKSLLEISNWDCACWDNDVNLNWSSWKDLLFAAVNECIPMTKTKKKPNAPWITKELLILCRKKKLLYKKAKRKNNESAWTKYRDLNNLLKKKYNQARWKHISELAQKLKEYGNAKPFCKYVKSKQKGTNTLVSLTVAESTLICYSIACCMNSYFSSVFTVEDYANLPELNYIVDK